MSRRGTTGPQPTRGKSDLADVVEMLLDKGVVINADIAVTVGDTELIGVKIRAALASFETAAKYGLEFPSGTDRRRVEAQTGVPAVTTDDGVDEDQTRLSELVFDDGPADVNVGPVPTASVTEDAEVEAPDADERDAETETTSDSEEDEHANEE
ncbi:Gas vesicle protein [Natronoarchaeum philippinense]|uniref:Gas vesicle protein n=1 Tax=Natronoarchaeum philippinense TaxID=558529 RepID=A0A285NWU9_NATPI|nr:gas vesicle protein [Natronoarchaeum philippinense]SNZ13403.1 Gas vesicle protein [Natronoarchaeum philippinense]